ncbi:RNA polymerase sigma factor [Spirillospora sp. NBC_01491]|uniref:RNA polymerase sigma factor n=1 Tax=Spirillospora sp. NBC_01491 TaxID=2976007 RepID=UPI002E35C026|nr:sigma-70 family RNA polymerase sigma factor [Spirillospora sp. NBC_01491]
MSRWSSHEARADRRLVQGLNEGDETVLGELYDAYSEHLFDYVSSMTGDVKTTADIVHDTFIDAYRRAPRMRDHLHLSSWLFGAARRRCVQRGHPAELYWDRDAEFSEAPARSGGPEARPLESDELHDLLRATLARMEPGDQEAILLAGRHRLRPSRLGAALGLSPRRAAMRVRKARLSMEDALKAEALLVAQDCATGRRSVRGGRAADAETELHEPTGPPADGDASAESSGDAPDGAKEKRGARSTTGRSFRSAAVVVLAARSPGPRQTPPPSHNRALAGGCAPRGEAGPPEDDSESNEPDLEQHIAACESCTRLDGLRAVALLTRAPSPVLPAALRHRVMHTATDPELAGYRADIAARGGALTPEGLPSQPDVPSPFTRRWLFTGGGMAGALVSALLAVMVMGPGLGPATLSWPPFGTRPQPSITHTSPSNGSGAEHGKRRSGERSQPPQAVGPALRPQTEGREPHVPTSPPHRSPAPPSSSPPRPAKPGDLVIAPGQVEMYGTKTATLRLKASGGRVTWTAMVSDGQIVLSQMQGAMAKGRSDELTVTLRTALIGLPGRGTITFTDSEGAVRAVTVVWGASLL